MLNVKKLAVAAAMILVAGSAFASNFRAADQVYVPIAGHVAGGGGTFISDVFMSNLSSDPVTVSVIFSTATNGVQTNFYGVINLAANERREILDFLPTVCDLSTCWGQ